MLPASECTKLRFGWTTTVFICSAEILSHVCLSVCLTGFSDCSLHLPPSASEVNAAIKFNFDYPKSDSTNYETGRQKNNSDEIQIVDFLIIAYEAMENGGREGRPRLN